MVPLSGRKYNYEGYLANVWNGQPHIQRRAALYVALLWLEQNAPAQFSGPVNACPTRQIYKGRPCTDMMANIITIIIIIII